MGLIALYDILEIQNYVYSSSKLKDNIGAATIVERCLDEYLEEALSNSKINYIFDKKTEEFKAINDLNIDGELVYTGGGNACVYFKNFESYKKVNRELSKIFIEKADGIRFCTDYLEISFDNNFGKDIKQLFKKIRKKKYLQSSMDRSKCISITRQCEITQKPATTIDSLSKNYISNELLLKRNIFKEYKEKYKEVQELAGNEGEKFVAVVHIDGNNMGKKLEVFLDKFYVYEDGINAIRKFSTDIQEIYESAYEKTKKEIEKLINNSSDERLKMFKNGEPPFRKILIKGDDVTFICYAPLALKAVEIFIKNVESDERGKNYNNLTACAGIAYVKPAYPFDIAYEIAEQCCSYAKTVSKKFVKSNKLAESYVDFHISHSNMMTQLSKLREREYNMNFLGETNENRYRSYNLMTRPYKITNKNELGLDTLFFICNSLKDNNLPKSKLKKIRNSYITNKYTLVKSIKELESQSNTKKYLDNLCKELKDKYDCEIDRETFMEKHTNTSILFDSIEIMDIYIEM